MLPSRGDHRRRRLLAVCAIAGTACREAWPRWPAVSQDVNGLRRQARRRRCRRFSGAQCTCRMLTGYPQGQCPAVAAEPVSIWLRSGSVCIKARMPPFFQRPCFREYEPEAARSRKMTPSTMPKISADEVAQAARRGHRRKSFKQSTPIDADRRQPTPTSPVLRRRVDSRR